MKSDPSRKGRRLILVSSVLAVAIAVPLIGGASAASLSSAPFAVKAQSASEGRSFAIKPFFEAKKTPTPEPTTPVTTAPVTPAPTPTAAPPFSPTTVFYHNGRVPASGIGTVESRQGAGAWSTAGISTNVTGQPTTLDQSNQLAFSVRTVQLKERSIRLTVPALEAGTYTFSLFGNADNPTIWEVSTEGAEPKSYSVGARVWAKTSLTFTTAGDSASRQILIKVTMPSPNQYGDTVLWDDVTLKRVA